MSWQNVDSNLVGTGKLSKAAIVGLQGGIWAKSADLNLTDAEVSALVSSLKKPESLFETGIKIGGTKYMTIRADDDYIAGKKGADGCVGYKSSQALLIGIYAPGVQPPEANAVVEELAKYLKSVSYGNNEIIARVNLVYLSNTCVSASSSLSISGASQHDNLRITYRIDVSRPSQTCPLLTDDEGIQFFVKGAMEADVAFEIGDIVLGQIEGWPPWPAKIVNPKTEGIPRRLLRSRHKDHNDFLIKFYSDSSYLWADAGNLQTLSIERISKFIADDCCPSNSLVAAYKLAQKSAQTAKLRLHLGKHNDAEAEVQSCKNSEPTGNTKRRKIYSMTIDDSAMDDSDDVALPTPLESVPLGRPASSFSSFRLVPETTNRFRPQSRPYRHRFDPLASPCDSTPCEARTERYTRREHQDADAVNACNRSFTSAHRDPAGKRVDVAMRRRLFFLAPKKTSLRLCAEGHVHAWTPCVHHTQKKKHVRFMTDSPEVATAAAAIGQGSQNQQRHEPCTQPESASDSLKHDVEKAGEFENKDDLVWLRNDLDGFIHNRLPLQAMIGDFAKTGIARPNRAVAPSDNAIFDQSQGISAHKAISKSSDPVPMNTANVTEPKQETQAAEQINESTTSKVSAETTQPAASATASSTAPSSKPKLAARLKHARHMLASTEALLDGLHSAETETLALEEVNRWNQEISRILGG